MGNRFVARNCNAAAYTRNRPDDNRRHDSTITVRGKRSAPFDPARHRLQDLWRGSGGALALTGLRALSYAGRLCGHEGSGTVDRGAVVVLGIGR